jgi:transposase InsO family protein
MTEAIYLEVSLKMGAAKKSKRQASVSGMLRKLGVSRSGYNSWLKRLPSDMDKRKEAIKVRIKELYEESKNIYGAPKITKLLQQEGEKISERTVGKYMREMKIKARWVRPWTVTTIDSSFSKDLHNILERDFTPQRPNAVWCSDITYIWTTEGFVYLTSVMDLYSRKIIAWSLSKTLKVSCVVDAINKAKVKRNTDQPIILHSDRGSQYVSKEYLRITKSMKLSYSRVSNPWDNACVEAFYALIKREWLQFYKIGNYDHAYRLVFEYIETFYNTVRIHGHCNYTSPDKYEKDFQEEKLQLLMAS